VSAVSLFFMGILMAFPHLLSGEPSLSVGRERVGDIMAGSPATIVWMITHDEVNAATCGQCVMLDVVVVVWLAVDGHRLDVAALALTRDDDLLAVL